ncbi:hypothetical protein GCM10027048_44180 [Hymenobacter coalescens]
MERSRREFVTNDGRGLTSLRYEVELNQAGLLTLLLVNETLGAYPSINTRRVVFDTRTGRRLRVADLIRPADTTALRQRWRRAISRVVAERIRAFAQDFPEEQAALPDLQEHLRWDAATRQVAFEPHEPRFDDFAVTRQGLTLYHSFGLPHVIQTAEPEGTFTLSYAELKPMLPPDGPLARLVPSPPG